LGHDRHGFEYWLIAKRIFVEKKSTPGKKLVLMLKLFAVEDSNTWDYSSIHQIIAYSFWQIGIGNERSRIKLRASNVIPYPSQPKGVPYSHVTWIIVSKIKGKWDGLLKQIKVS